MNGARILVVEDDANIREGLVATLQSEGYAVTAAEDGREALDLFSQQPCDLVVLDIMMPRVSGYDVCRAIRRNNATVPIIMLTAKGEEIDKVVGLELGADDYVTKPFGIRELLARIEAVLRRAHAAGKDRKGKQPALPDTFAFGPAEVDTRRYKLRIGRREVNLTDREVRLLEYFKAHANDVLSRDELLNEVWGIEYYGTTRTLDQHIARVRKKLRQSGAPSCIATIHGVGYRYEEPAP